MGLAKRDLVRPLASLVLIASVAQADRDVGPVANPTVMVYRSPSCGCCGAWMAHLRRNDFAVMDVLSASMEVVKRRYNIPEQLRSCHTAVVDGYLIEGHVPAADIRRLLQERPPVVGLAVPGMPAGSPGMEVGGRQGAYAVLAFTQDGSSSVFQEHKLTR